MSSAAAPASREVDPRAFRSALGRFASGVTFVTTSLGGTPAGLVVSAFTSVSLDPPLVSFCPSRSSLTWQRMRCARRFAVNVLGSSHEEFVRRAAPAGVERFRDVAWHRSDGGLPELRDALAVIECETVAEHAAGDHWIVVGRVASLRWSDAGRPLVSFAGELHGIR